MRALIVDDELYCRKAIRSYLEEEFDEISLVEEAGSVNGAIKKVEDFDPDIVFLDVQLGTSTCFEILDALREIKFKIVFTTAYEDYALRAFDYPTVHYLVKPVEISEMEKAIARCLESSHSEPSDIKAAKGLFLKQIDQAFNIAFDEISHLEADGGYSKIFKIDGTSVFMSKNLGSYEKALPQSFVRVHNSYIINIEQVEKVDFKNKFIRLKSGLEVSFSRRKAGLLRDAMEKY